MQITDAVSTPTFANHESFHLRYGWLKKAYNEVLKNPGIFVSDDASIRLGVGKNMVRSIRFWALSCKVMETGPKNSQIQVTRIGDAIFRERRGLDPYLEDPQTLWLLHWLLFAPPCRIPVWWIIMNEFPAANIRTGDLTESVQNRILNMSEWNTPSSKSIKKDVDVFVHTYTTDQGTMSMEDYLDCPFRQMRMVRQRTRGEIRFVFGRKYGMTPSIVAHACLDFINRRNIASKSISVTQLATEPGSVGNVFKIGENDLGQLLADACGMSDCIRMEDVNGAQRLMFDDAGAAAEIMLGKAYGKSRQRLDYVNKVMAN